MRQATFRLATLALAILALAGPAAAQSAQAGARLPSGWMADARRGCKVWNPQPEPGETVEWSGGCTDGLASGPGVTRWLENGLVTERTEGTRVAGHLQGPGVTELPNGDRFEGAFKDDRKDGRGSYVAADGMSYVGEFRNDQFEGFGVLTDTKGNRYEGAWKAGRRNGQGTLTAPDGTSISGLWVNDEPVGGGSAI